MELLCLLFCYRFDRSNTWMKQGIPWWIKNEAEKITVGEQWTYFYCFQRLWRDKKFDFPIGKKWNHATWDKLLARLLSNRFHRLLTGYFSIKLIYSLTVTKEEDMLKLLCKRFDWNSGFSRMVLICIIILQEFWDYVMYNPKLIISRYRLDL